MAKSIEKQPMIIPGIYEGVWSAYYVKIKYKNGNMSSAIQLDSGIRGVNCECTVEVKDDGYVYVT